MRTQPFGTQLIERYLRTRRVRYFPGRHDGEFFFIVTADDQRLHVHIEVSGANAVTIRITPASFFPAADRERLLKFEETWNQDNQRVKAVLHESTDPNRIGVVAESSLTLAGFDSFADVADHAIQSATVLFAELTPAASAQHPEWVLDAG